MQQMANLFSSVLITINYWVCGKFIFKDGGSEYVGGALLRRSSVKVSELSVEFLRKTAYDGMRALTGKDTPYFSMWFKFKHKGLVGRRGIDCQADIEYLVASRDKENVVVVYTNEEKSPAEIFGFGKSYINQKQKPKPVKKEKDDKGVGLQVVGDQLRPVRRSPRFKDGGVVLLGDDCTPTKAKNPPAPKKSLTFTNSSPTDMSPNFIDKNSFDPTTLTKDNISPKKATTPRRKQVARKPKPTTKTTSASKKPASQKTKVKTVRKTKVRKSTKTFLDDFDSGAEGGGTSDSEWSDLDIEFEVGEEDKELGQDDDVASRQIQTQDLQLADQFKEGAGKCDDTTDAADGAHKEELHGISVNEPELNDEDLGSLKGSDDEVDDCPEFNPEVDFRQKIQLVRGLKFPNVYVLRKAIRHHSVEKRMRAEDYVHEFYTKDKYIEAYTPYIRPMPGMMHWEKASQTEPLPPIIRNLPGRPSLKKRKKEAGETQERAMNQGKRVNRCSNCRQPGHNKKNCKAQAAPSEKKQGGRPSAVNDPWVDAQKNRKKAKVSVQMDAVGYNTVELSQGGPSTQQSQVTAEPLGSQPRQPTQKQVTRPKKLPTKAKPKKN